VAKGKSKGKDKSQTRFIPIIGFHWNVMEELKSGEMVDLSEGGVNLKLIYLDARKQRKPKGEKIVAGPEVGNGIPKLKRGQKRRQFTEEFKKQVVQRIENDLKRKVPGAVSRISDELEIHRSVLDGWRRGRGTK
jgi:hypothetical protein